MNITPCWKTACMFNLLHCFASNFSIAKVQKLVYFSALACACKCVCLICSKLLHYIKLSFICISFVLSKIMVLFTVLYLWLKFSLLAYRQYYSLIFTSDPAASTWSQQTLIVSHLIGESCQPSDWWIYVYNILFYSSFKYSTVFTIFNLQSWVLFWTNFFFFSWIA